MTRALARALALAALLGAATTAHAYCANEVSPCYRWDRYLWNGATWCRHWPFGVSDGVYCVNSTLDIGPVTFRDASAAAYQAWQSQVSVLPYLTFSALPPADTTTASYLMWVDDATWSARGFPANAAATTYKRVFSDGTVAHGRTWFHLKSSSWGWSPDCVNNDCTGGGLGPGKLDYPSIAAHELGHWWVLLDISVSGCEYVLMWNSIAVNTVKRTPQFPDVYGAVTLYDQPVEVNASLASVDAEPDLVRLVWYSRQADLSATVERSRDGVTWSSRGTLSPDGSGYLRYDDTGVEAGARYGYRLRVTGPAGDDFSSETWVDVPSWRLALAPVVPNPATSSDLKVSFVLPDASPAWIDVVDVAGRRLSRLDVGTLGRGSHTLSLGREALRPGMYWVRLSQGTETRIARAVVLR